LKTFFKDRTPKDPKYLKWIDTQPCLVCGGQSTHHHWQEKGHGKKGGKCSDYRAVPLCFGPTGHHEEFHRVGRDTFAASHRIDIEKEISRLLAKWQNAHPPA
jgi:hypothetical protein